MLPGPGEQGLVREIKKLDLRRTRTVINNNNRLGRPDSNQDKRIQSPLCYRCTTPQRRRPEAGRPVL